MSIKDGGPAFPCNRTVGPTDGTVEDFRAYGTGDEGMSLRDWFAGQANALDIWPEEGLPYPVAKFLLDRECPNCSADPAGWATFWTEALAAWKYAAADAMLAARGVKP